MASVLRPSRGAENDTIAHGYSDTGLVCQQTIVKGYEERVRAALSIAAVNNEERMTQQQSSITAYLPLLAQQSCVLEGT